MRKALSLTSGSSGNNFFYNHLFYFSLYYVIFVLFSLFRRAYFRYLLKTQKYYKPLNTSNLNHEKELADRNDLANAGLANIINPFCPG